MKPLLVAALVLSSGAVTPVFARGDVPGVSPEVAATLTPAQIAQIRFIHERESNTLKIKQRVRAILARRK